MTFLETFNPVNGVKFKKKQKNQGQLQNSVLLRQNSTQADQWALHKWAQEGPKSLGAYSIHQGWPMSALHDGGVQVIR